MGDVERIIEICELIADLSLITNGPIINRQYFKIYPGQLMKIKLQHGKVIQYHTQQTIFKELPDFFPHDDVILMYRGVRRIVAHDRPLSFSGKSLFTPEFVTLDNMTVYLVALSINYTEQYNVNHVYHTTGPQHLHDTLIRVALL